MCHGIPSTPGIRAFIEKMWKMLHREPGFLLQAAGIFFLAAMPEETSYEGTFVDDSEDRCEKSARHLRAARHDDRHGNSVPLYGPMEAKFCLCNICDVVSCLLPKRSSEI